MKTIKEIKRQDVEVQYLKDKEIAEKDLAIGIF